MSRVREAESLTTIADSYTFSTIRKSLATSPLALRPNMKSIHDDVLDFPGWYVSPTHVAKGFVRQCPRALSKENRNSCNESIE